MKKIITILSFAALLFSCAKPIEQPEIKLNTYTIEADLSGDDTKINYKDGKGYEWAGGEKIAVIKVDDGLGTKTESDGVGSDTQDAQFSVTVEDGSYIAVHPETVGIQDGKLQFEFLANQRQTFGGETYSTIYDGSKRIPLVSQTKFSLDSEHQVVSQKFNPVGALIRFSIYGGDQGEQIRSVSVVAPAGTAIAGTVLYSCSFDGDALTVTPDSYSNTTNKVRVLVHEDAHKAGAADAPSIFATIIPANFQPTYVVETLDKVYTFSSANTKNFEASNRYDVKLNLKSTNASITRLETKVPQQLFIVGDAFENIGWDGDKAEEMIAVEQNDRKVFFTSQTYIKGNGFRFLTHNLLGLGDSYYNSGNWNLGYSFNDGDLNTFIINDAENDKENWDIFVAFAKDGSWKKADAWKRIDRNNKFPNGNGLYLTGDAWPYDPHWHTTHTSSQIAQSGDENSYSSKLYLQNGAFRFLSKLNSGWDNGYDKSPIDGSLVRHHDNLGTLYEINEGIGFYNVTVQFTETGSTVTLDRVTPCLVGNDNWTPRAMTKVSDGVYTIKEFLNANAGFKFTFDSPGEWWDATYQPWDEHQTSLTGNLFTQVGNSYQDNQIKVSESATYKITINTNNLTFEIVKQ